MDGGQLGPIIGVVSVLSALIGSVLTARINGRTAVGVAAETAAATIHAAEDKTESDRLEKYLDVISADNERMRTDLDEMKKQHHECELQIIENRSQISKLEALVDILRDEVNHLRSVGTPISLREAGRVMVDSMVERVEEVVPQKKEEWDGETERRHPESEAPAPEERA